MSWWISDMGLKELAQKIRDRVIPNVRYLPRSRIRHCRACTNLSLIVAIGDGDEFEVCIRCRANFRYELLADYIRERYPRVDSLDVLELDFRSPLRHLFETSKTYTPTFFRENVPPGTRRDDGVICQDITNLTFADESLDLIVSSDVLEHVPDLQAAFNESARTLRPGGCHIFTAPPRPRTRQRARVINGTIDHLLDPEYHLDPLSREGILAFWDIGPDLPHYFKIPNLTFRQVRGPEGTNERTVWEAFKVKSHE
jgi:SAM-dependent methyltransferase